MTDHKDDDVLIFCNWKMEITLLYGALAKMGQSVITLDGSCSHSMRDTLIDIFNRNSKRSVLLINKVVGSCGLNLQKASVVYILSPDWNPAVDHQAMSRVYRIGQDKEVTIYRLMIKDTREVNVICTQVKKLYKTAEMMNDETIMEDMGGHDTVVELAQQNNISLEPEDESETSKVKQEKRRKKKILDDDDDSDVSENKPEDEIPKIQRGRGKKKAKISKLSPE
jgi:superfamily II DNA or RNA helicase